MSATVRKGDLTKQRLIREMMRLTHLRGFGATSINDVIAASGIKKGALYHHFSAKDDLGIAALDQWRSDFDAFLRNALDGRTGLDALDSFLQAALDKHRGRAFVGGCPFGNTALEMADGDSRYAEAVSAVFDAWVLKLQGAIAAGQQAGEIRDDMAAEDLARLVVATVEGGIMLSRLKKEEGPMRGCIESLRKMLVERG